MHRTEPFADGDHSGARVSRPTLADRVVTGQGRCDWPGTLTVGLQAEHERSAVYAIVEIIRAPRLPGPAGSRQAPI